MSARSSTRNPTTAGRRNGSYDMKVTGAGSTNSRKLHVDEIQCSHRFVFVELPNQCGAGALPFASNG